MDAGAGRLQLHCLPVQRPREQTRLTEWQRLNPITFQTRDERGEPWITATWAIINPFVNISLCFLCPRKKEGGKELHIFWEESYSVYLFVRRWRSGA